MSIFKKRGDEVAEDHQKETPANAEAKKKQSENAVLRYVIVLFVIIMALLVLSYFVQQRRSEDKIDSLTEQHSAFTMQAQANIEKLQDKNESLSADLAEAQKRADGLQKELETEKAAHEKDVAELNAKSKEEFNNQYQKTQAIEHLLALYMAQQNGGDTAAALNAMAPYEQYLDGAYTELYQTIKNQLNPEENEQ